MSAVSTAVAQLSTDARGARRLADLLAQLVDPTGTAIAAIARRDGNWSLELHFGSPPDQAEIRKLVALVAGAEVGSALTFGALADTDWVAASLEALAPVPAGRFMVHGAHHRSRVTSNRIGIEIEAARAFGTGHHGTTRACLIALDRLLKRGRPRRVLDVGTGTGVLAIAAAKALRRSVMAGDIDRHAVNTARANVGRNGVRNLVRVVHAAGIASPRLRAADKFDLMLANVLREPLRRLAAPAPLLLAPDARIVLSGLLCGQEHSVLAVWQPRGFMLERRITLDGWTTLVLERIALRPCRRESLARPRIRRIVRRSSPS
jgi:ribosomal protein L11 methyltransferase